MYLVIEVQDDGNHVGTLSYEFDNYEDAEAKYHTILSVAAKSSVRCHGAIIIGGARVINYEGFEHIPPEEMV